MNDNNFVDEMVKLDKSLNPAKNTPGDWQKMMDYLRENTMQEDVNKWSKKLKIPSSNLVESSLVVGEYKGQDVCMFPMVDHWRQVCGFRLRSTNGAKFSWPGSRQGHFMGTVDHGSVLLITEGPTDAACGRVLGFDTIGRPNANSCVDDLVHIVRHFYATRSIIIIADDDEVGMAGAKALASALYGVTVSVKIVVPYVGKDLRDWVHGGLTQLTLLKAIEEAAEYVEEGQKGRDPILTWEFLSCDECLYGLDGICISECPQPIEDPALKHRCKYGKIYKPERG